MRAANLPIVSYIPPKLRYLWRFIDFTVAYNSSLKLGLLGGIMNQPFFLSASEQKNKMLKFPHA